MLYAPLRNTPYDHPDISEKTKSVLITNKLNFTKMETTKVGLVTIIKGVKRKQASFKDFDATKFNKVRTVVSKKEATKGDVFIIGNPVVKHVEDGEEKDIFMSLNEACALHNAQAADAKIPMFVNEKGTRAVIGEQGYLNPAVTLARINSELVLADK